MLDADDMIGEADAVWSASGLDAGSLASLLELAHDAALVRAPDGRILFWNLGAEDLYGWSKADALGQISHELLGTESDATIPEIEQQLLATGRWEGRIRHRTKAGETVTVESRWVMHTGERRLAAVLEVNRDITKRLIAEQALAAEAERFRAIFEASLDAIFLTALDGRILAANGAAQAMFGWSEAEFVAGGRELLVDTADPRLAAALRERRERGRARAELRAFRADGSAFEIELSSVVFRDAAGELRTSMVVRDVTERTAALRAARESESRFRALADAVGEGVFLHEDGRIIEVNRAACALLGRDEEELRGMHVLDVIHPDEAGRVRAILQSRGDEEVETRAVRADGVEVPIATRGRCVAYDGRFVRVVAVRAL